MYIGHKNDTNDVQPLRDHLVGVSRMAADFCAPFSAQDHGRRTGILHDAGKYSAAAQRRMADPEHTPKVDHSTTGARIAMEQCKDVAGALAIAGHHGGMSDLGGKMTSEGDGTLRTRLKKDLSGELDASAFWEENEIDRDILLPKWLIDAGNPFAVPSFVS